MGTEHLAPGRAGRWFPNQNRCVSDTIPSCSASHFQNSGSHGGRAGLRFSPALSLRTAASHHPAWASGALPAGPHREHDQGDRGLGKSRSSCSGHREAREWPQGRSGWRERLREQHASGPGRQHEAEAICPGTPAEAAPEHELEGRPWRGPILHPPPILPSSSCWTLTWLCEGLGRFIIALHLSFRSPVTHLAPRITTRYPLTLTTSGPFPLLRPCLNTDQQLTELAETGRRRAPPLCPPHVPGRTHGEGSWQSVTWRDHVALLMAAHWKRNARKELDPAPRSQEPSPGPQGQRLLCRG